MKSRLCFTLALFFLLLGGCDAVGENPAYYEHQEEYHAYQAEVDLLEAEVPSPTYNYTQIDTSGWGN